MVDLSNYVNVITHQAKEQTVTIIGNMSDPFHVETSRTADSTKVTLECWRKISERGYRSVERRSLPVLDDEAAHDQAVITAAHEMLRRAAEEQ